MQDVYEDNVILRNMRNEFVHKQIEVWGFDYISDLFDSGYEPQFLRDRNSGEYTWVWIQVSVSHAHQNSLNRA
jgi:poly-D-alanine transfer protein DltD